MHRPGGYPIFVNLADCPVLIVGGGKVGLRKARGAAEAGGRVTVVSLAFAEGFEALAGVRRVTGAYAAERMGEARWRLVFAATDAGEVNARVQADATAAGILCCRCDLPEAGDFAGGAVARAGEIVVAVGTAGASPGVAARIAREAAAGIDPVMREWAGCLGRWREQVKAEVRDAGVRRALLQRVVGAEMETALRANGVSGGEKMFEQWLTAARDGQMAAEGAGDHDD